MKSLLKVCTLSYLGSLVAGSQWLSPGRNVDSSYGLRDNTYYGAGDAYLRRQSNIGYPFSPVDDRHLWDLDRDINRNFRGSARRQGNTNRPISIAPQSSFQFTQRPQLNPKNGNNFKKTERNEQYLAQFFGSNRVQGQNNRVNGKANFVCGKNNQVGGRNNNIKGYGNIVNGLG